MGSRVLITGGAGFVGSNLAASLAQKGYDVTVYDNLSRKSANVDFLRQQPSLKIVRGELDDIGDFLDSHSFDLIYHFAAQVAVTTSYESPRSDFRINAQGTFKLVMAAKNTPIIYASTNKVYGDNANKIPIRELETRFDFDHHYAGRGIPEHLSIDTDYHTPYGLSKLVGEFFVREGVRSKDPTVARTLFCSDSLVEPVQVKYGGVANRFSCMYGPHQFGHEDQGWVAHFAISKELGRPVTIYGNGKQVRDLLYVSDVVALLERQAEMIDSIRGEAFNIGGGPNNVISLLELCKHLEIEPATFGPERPADQKVYYSDIGKAKKILGWEPQVSIADGLSYLRSWIRGNKELF